MILQHRYTNEMEGVLHVIVGCGLTGSNVAEMLVRSGAEKFLLIDHDIVEKRNLGGQWYNPQDVEDRVSKLFEEEEEDNDD